MNADQRSQMRLSFAWLDWRAETVVGFMSQGYLFLESNQARAVSVAVNTRTESLNAHTCWSLNLGVVCEADESSPQNSACYEMLNRDTDLDKFFRWGHGKLAGCQHGNKLHMLTNGGNFLVHYFWVEKDWADLFFICDVLQKKFIRNKELVERCNQT